MGCQESKANRIRPHRRFDRTVTPEKVVTRSLWKEGVQCPVDDRQAFKIKQSWKGIRRNMEVTGIEMFMRLFRSNSELQAMFKGFKDIKTDSELRSNEALENHATLVMTTLDDAITHIDNYEYVKDLLYRTSATHTKFTGFQPAYFMHVKEPFLEAVRVTLGDRYTDNMQNIYTIAITYVLQTLKEGMEEALK
ncbi:neuroglobin-like isoform X4 [Biomphalaria glabrata]|uniref:Globin n=1 Tax=Biomphalaria glabrata TaxID=6526 RepID=A0A9W3A1Q0_BIOGL|nr:neuroglobin-like isoform X4 [Biomphalaria glabrata]